MSDLGFRWGSCGKAGVLYFNWRLFRLPIGLVDYVLVHEMAHLRESTHSPEFWRIVERALPDWREKKEKLADSSADVRWKAMAGETKG